MKRVWVPLGGFVLVVAVVVAYNVGRARAYGIPQTNTLAYSGTLLTFGQPDNGTHLIGLALYLTSGTATTCVLPAVTTQVTSGQFTVPLPESCVQIIHQNQGLQVQINIDGTALAMQPITAVPYAVEAETASNAAPGSPLAFASQLVTDTSGGVTCSGLGGHVRFTGTQFQACNGTTWVAFNTTSLTTSCLAILNAGISTGNGNYTVNAQGVNIQAYCDMVTAGGGWTEVWQESNLDPDNSALAYFPNMSTILSQSTSMMFAFINPGAVTTTNSGLTEAWYFPTPANFVATTPMAVGQCVYQSITATRVADGSQATQVLRAGWGSFGNQCDDSCAGTYGEICLKGTTTDGFSDFPMFTAFAANVNPNLCSPSNGAYNADACSPSRLFAIFVR